MQLGHDEPRDDDDFFNEPQVDLIEESSGRILPCFMAASLEYEGETFAALYPVDAPVCLAEMSAEKLMPLDEARETEALVAQCISACADNSIELVNTPVVMTARGPGLELSEGDIEALQIIEDDEDEESEEAIVLATVDHEGGEVMVVQTLDPLYVVGKKLDEVRYVIPDDDAMEAVSDTIEQLVIEFEEGMESEDDDFDVIDDFDDHDFKP